MTVSFAKLTGLKPSKKLRNEGFYTFDVETKDGLKGTQLYCWGLAFKKQGGKYGYIKGFEDLSEMFELFKLWKDKSHYKTIIVHNLSFDIRFIIKECMIRDIKFQPIISGSKFIACMLDEYHVKFVDSVQFFQTSQEIAEIEWKVDLEYVKSNTNSKRIFEKNFDDWSYSDKLNVIEHNINDIIALHIAFSKFRQTMFNIAEVDVLSVISMASLAMKAYRVQMYKHNIVIDNPFLYFKKSDKSKRPYYMIDKMKEEFVRKSYYGGRNEVFDLNRQYDALYIDRVSMFPAEMANQDYPKGIPFWMGKTDLEKEKLMNLIKETSKLGVIYCKIYPPKEKNRSKYPILPKRIDKKVMYTYCEFYGWYTNVELHYAYKMGYQIIPIKGLIYPEKGKIFTQYVKKFIKLKEESEGGIRKGAKILLNGVYGKFGQKFEMDAFSTKYCITENEMLAISDKYDNNHDELIIRYNDEVRLYMIMERYKSVIKKPFQNITIASFTTSYARISLVKLMHLVEKRKPEKFKHQMLVKYVDTDSITVNPIVMNLIQDQLGKQLGNWDIEQQFNEVQFLAPKAYISLQQSKKDFEFTYKGKVIKVLKGTLIPKLKLKGVQTSKIKEICNDVLGMYLENSQLNMMNEIEKQIREPIQMAEIYMKYKEAFRNGMVLATKEPSKEYSFENLKRNFNIQTKTSQAWEMHTIPENYKIELGTQYL